MNQQGNKLSQFWQELKRRKVVRVILMYAGVAFIITELVNNISEPLYLPDWIATFVILLLIIGFPIIAILSWIFDVTPEGIKKTERAEVVREKEIETKPIKRKLRISDVIIAVLLVVVGILVYPKIFKRDKLASLRDEEGRISIAVMPFQNMTNDTLWDVWQGGIQNELITNLSNSKELSVRQYQTMLDIFQSSENMNYASITPSVAVDISRKLQVSTFIQGSIKSTGTKIRINAHLIDADTEEIYRTFQINGNTEEDIFIITDSLSKLLRNYLEIKVLEQDVDYDFRNEITARSAEAYRYYMQGTNLEMRTDYYNAIESFKNALRIDTNFIAARIGLISAYFTLGMAKELIEQLHKVYEQIENISYSLQLWVKYYKSFFDKDMQAAINFMGQLIEYDPQLRIAWYMQGYNYNQIYQYEKAIHYFEKAIEIDQQWGSNSKWPGFYVWSGFAYHKLGNHDREGEIYEMGLNVMPDWYEILFLQAVCALSQDDTSAAMNYIAKYKSKRETDGVKEYWINYNIGRIYRDAEQFNKAMDIIRELTVKDPQEPWSKFRLGYILIDKEINVEEGMMFIDQALEINPNNNTFIYAHGLGLYKQGKLNEALEVLNKSWENRYTYNHDHYLLIQEVEQALASHNH